MVHDKTERSIKLKLNNCYVKDKTGKLSLTTPKTIENKLANLITTVHNSVANELKMPKAMQHHQALYENDEKRKYDAKLLEKEPSPLKPVEHGRQAGITDTITVPGAKEYANAYRVKQLVVNNIVKSLKSWDGSYRTLPKAGWTINLSAILVMAHSEQRNNMLFVHIELEKTWYVLTFNIPKHARKRGKITSPTINYDPNTGVLSYYSTLQEKSKRTAFSSKYVIGLDRGVVEFGTWVLYDMGTGRGVLTGTLSDELKQLYGRVRSLESQVKRIREKADRLVGHRALKSTEYYGNLMGDLRAKRGRLTRLKNELAKGAAQELVALAGAFDNCAIAIEQLNWAGNWRSRVPFGLFAKWIEHFCERVGIICVRVSAAYTSQDCSCCGAERSGFFLDRTFVCKACGVMIDRDINAAVNIAARATKTVKKSAATRAKRKDLSLRVPLTPHKKIRTNFGLLAGLDDTGNNQHLRAILDSLGAVFEPVIINGNPTTRITVLLRV